MGENRWKIQNVKDVLLRFDKKPGTARQKYRAFLQDGMKLESDLYEMVQASNDEKENSRNTGSWVIGNRDFVQKAMEQHDRNLLRKNSGAEVTVEDVTAAICGHMGVELEAIQRKSRGNASSKARRIISFISNRKHHIPTGVIACYLNVTLSAVSNMVREGETLVKKDDGKFLNY